MVESYSIMPAYAALQDVVEVDPARTRYRLLGPNRKPFYMPEAGPFEIETNPITVTFSSNAASLAVERVGPNGSPLSRHPLSKHQGRFTFSAVSLADQKPWYRITARRSD